MTYLAWLGLSMAAHADAALVEERTEVDGARSPEALHQAVGAWLERVGPCVKVDPAPDDSGTVSLGFLIDEAGAAGSVVVEGGSLLSPLVRACVEEHAARLAFGVGPACGARLVVALAEGPLGAPLPSPRVPAR